MVTLLLLLLILHELRVNSLQCKMGDKYICSCLVCYLVIIVSHVQYYSKHLLPLHLPLDPSHATTRKQAHTTACCPRSQARLRLPHHCSHMLPWGQRLDDRFCPQQLQTAALMETLVPDRTQGVSIVYSRTHTQIVSLVLNVYTSIGWTIQSLWPNHKREVSILTCSVHRVDKTNI